MARAVPTPLRPRTPRYSDSIACESHLEAAEAARRVLAFTEDELRAGHGAAQTRLPL